MNPIKPCPFCSPQQSDIIAKNELCYARWDRFPVSRGHALVIPFRHVPDLFSLTLKERCALLALADDCKSAIEAQYSPAGYNIGINVGGSPVSPSCTATATSSPGTRATPAISAAGSAG